MTRLSTKTPVNDKDYSCIKVNGDVVNLNI